MDHGEEGSTAQTDNAWCRELESRVDEVLDGTVELVDADETYQLLSAELASRCQ